MKKIIFIIYILMMCFLAHPTLAAMVSFNATPEIMTGEVLDLEIQASTNETSINSIEMQLKYDDSLLVFTGYSDENGVIKLWIDPPHISKENSDEITFSGIIPGGVIGLYDAKSKGLAPFPIVHLFFKAKYPGKAGFYFTDSKLLKHDGIGTPLVHDKFPIEITIKDNPNIKTNINIPDQEITQKEVDNSSRENTTHSTLLFGYPFWIILTIIVCGIVGYKLLKY